MSKSAWCMLLVAALVYLLCAAPIWAQVSVQAIVPETGVRLSGRSFPLARVSITQGTRGYTVSADAGGSWSITIERLDPGTYAYAINAQDVSSAQYTPTITTTVTIEPLATSIPGTILMPPLLKADRASIDEGGEYRFSGIATPGSIISLRPSQPVTGLVFGSVVAGSDGSYTITGLLDTRVSPGSYDLISTASLDGLTSESSQMVRFFVQSVGIGASREYCPLAYPLLCQIPDPGGGVDIDRYIELFRTAYTSDTQNPRADIDANGRIDARDIALVFAHANFSDASPPEDESLQLVSATGSTPWSSRVPSFRSPAIVPTMQEQVATGVTSLVVGVVASMIMGLALLQIMQPARLSPHSPLLRLMPGLLALIVATTYAFTLAGVSSSLEVAKTDRVQIDTPEETGGMEVGDRVSIPVSLSPASPSQVADIWLTYSPQTLAIDETKLRLTPGLITATTEPQSSSLHMIVAHPLNVSKLTITIPVSALRPGQAHLSLDTKRTAYYSTDGNKHTSRLSGEETEFEVKPLR